MFGLIKKMIIGLLNGLVNESNLTKCVALRNQKCMIKPTLNLHRNEYSQELHYYPFSVNKIDVLEVVILLMTLLVKYVFQTKQKIHI